MSGTTTTATTHYHVASGLTGYGPEPDDGGFFPLPTLEAVSDYVRDELRVFSDMAYESADALADSGDFEAAWNERKRSDALELLRSNLDNARAGAPLYAGKPALWRETLDTIIGETFPLDVSHNTRLYVWTCSESECLDLLEA